VKISICKKEKQMLCKVIEEYKRKDVHRIEYNTLPETKQSSLRLKRDLNATMFK